MFNQLQTLIPHTRWERHKKEIFQNHHTPLQNQVSAGKEKGYDFHSFTQDLFSALYQIKPQFPENNQPGTAWAQKALAELQSLPEYQQIRHQGTICDELQSGLGTTCLAKHFAESLPVMQTENPDNINNRIQDLFNLLEDVKDPDAQKKLQNEAAQLQQTCPPSEQEWTQMAEQMDAAAIRQVWRKALAEAQQQIEQVESMANSWGYGTDGSDGYTDPQLKLALSQRIQNQPKLVALANLAGRFRREARKQQSNKKQPGPDELTDIETGNDLGRLIPAELMKLGNEVTEWDFAKKYLERSLLQYRLTEVPKENKGPIVFCLDNSASMVGDREIWSKAVAMAMCQIAVDQKRPFVIIHFDGVVRKTVKFVPGSVNPTDLVEAMSYFSCGSSTDFDPPLVAAINIINEHHKKADIVFITDGHGTLSPETASKMHTSKQEVGWRLFLVVIGGTSDALQGVTDRTVHLADLDLNDKNGGGQDAKEVLFDL